jgi:hypothetical protein
MDLKLDVPVHTLKGKEQTKSVTTFFYEGNICVDAIMSYDWLAENKLAIVPHADALLYLPSFQKEVPLESECRAESFLPSTPGSSTNAVFHDVVKAVGQQCLDDSHPSQDKPDEYHTTKTTQRVNSQFSFQNQTAVTLSVPAGSGLTTSVAAIDLPSHTSLVTQSGTRTVLTPVFSPSLDSPREPPAPINAVQTPLLFNESPPSESTEEKLSVATQTEPLHTQSKVPVQIQTDPSTIHEQLLLLTL